MTITLTKEQLIEMKPCRANKYLALFKDSPSLTVKQALDAGASVSDILWVAGKLGLTDQIVQFAGGCARASTAVDAVDAYGAGFVAGFVAHVAVDAVDAVDAAARAARAAGFFAGSVAHVAADRAAEIERQKAHLIELFG